MQKEREERILHNKLVNEFHDKLQKEAQIREKIVGERLKNEFDLKLKKKIQENEGELKERKLHLELEMQKNIKRVLNQ